MNDTELAFATPADTGPWKRRLLYSPLARLVFFALLYVGLDVAFGILVSLARPPGYRYSGLGGTFVILALDVLPALIAYVILVRSIEHRRLQELRVSDLLRYGGLGMLGGISLFSAVVAVLSLAGSYHAIGFNPHAHWLRAALLSGIGAGVGEELVSRGALFRIVEEGLGTWAALLVSAVFFGAMHLANPAASWWSSAAIAIEGGLLLAMLYHVTRSLWPCIGLHAGWNFAQGTIYGIPVSGTRPDGWLVSSRTGPDWLSGGAFGAEASVIATAACSIVTLMLLSAALRKGTIVAPFWMRQRRFPTRETISPAPAPGRSPGADC